MERIIKKGVLELFDVEDQNIGVESRLLGGMSNFTYIVGVEDISMSAVAQCSSIQGWDRTFRGIEDRF